MHGSLPTIAPRLAAGFLTLAALAPVSAQVVVTTPAINQAAVADTDGRVGLNLLVNPPEITDVSQLNQGFPATVNFDVPRYNAGGVLTDVTFQARVGAASVSYGGTPLQSGTVTLGSTITLGGTAVQGYGTTIRVLGVGGGTIGAYDTDLGTIAAGALGGFFGAGTATGQWTELLTVDRIGLIPDLTFRANPGSHTADVTVNYTAVGHADGSFSSDPTANTTSLAAFNGAGSQSFNIHNASGRFALEVSNIDCSGDCGYFMPMGSWSAVAGGSFATGAIDYNGLAPGSASATFRFTIGDSTDSGLAGVGRLGELETLTLTVTAVPEPPALVLAVTGAGLLLVAARRRRRAAT
jgi:hypothetical protein